MAFEVFLQQGPGAARRWLWPTCLASLSLHFGLLVAVGVHSFWQVEELSPRGLGVTFLSVGTPPVPPPPPAPRKVAVTQSRAKPPPALRLRPDQIVQPREQPQPDPGAGEAGSTSGEVKGVVAGVEASGERMAAAGDQAPSVEPRVVELTPVMLGPSMGVSQRLSDLSDPRFRPTLPPPLNRPGTTVRGLFQICVSAAGQVREVKVLRSADPLVDGDWTTVIRRWQYKPFNLNGHPTPFCHPLTLEVQSLRG